MTPGSCRHCGERSQWRITALTYCPERTIGRTDEACDRHREHVRQWVAGAGVPVVVALGQPQPALFDEAI